MEQKSDILVKLQELINETVESKPWYSTLKDTEPIRRALLAILAEEDLTMDQTAKGIGICAPTLRNFVKTGKAHIRTVTRIEKFIDFRRKKKTDSYN